MDVFEADGTVFAGHAFNAVVFSTGHVNRQAHIALVAVEVVGCFAHSADATTFAVVLVPRTIGIFAPLLCCAPLLRTREILDTKAQPGKANHFGVLWIFSGFVFRTSQFREILFRLAIHDS